MLPQKINEKVCSLKSGQKKYVVTLSIMINNKGIVNFKTLKYF